MIKKNPVELATWKIYCISSRLWEFQTLHLCGIDKVRDAPVVSKIIIHIDSENKILTDEFGDIYKPIGDSGFNEHTAYFWGSWCKQNMITEFSDVTFDYIK